MLMSCMLLQFCSYVYLAQGGEGTSLLHGRKVNYLLMRLTIGRMNDNSNCIWAFLHMLSVSRKVVGGIDMPNILDLFYARTLS